MSNAEKRQEIAAALSKVAVLRGHAARPATLNEGDAWPQWRGAEMHAYAYQNTWAVLIVLPQSDDVTADGFADDHLDEILDKLRDAMNVDSIAPATIPAGNGDMYALLITGTSE